MIRLLQPVDTRKGKKMMISVESYRKDGKTVLTTHRCFPLSAKPHVISIIYSWNGFEFKMHRVFEKSLTMLFKYKIRFIHQRI